ncbi:MAG: hypothetical protein JW760_10265 [Spirochaetales bacterium]|nr:hypothetical protein [Spirochaetales bacterium]
MEYFEITGFLGGKLEEIRELCRTYVRGITNTGSRNLIYSLTEQKKAQLIELEDLSGDHELNRMSFSDAKVHPLLEKVADFSLFHPAMEPKDFLIFIEQRLIAFYSFYAFLAESVPGGDTAYVFRRLEEEDRKQAALLKDRIDLLNLSS